MTKTDIIANKIDVIELPNFNRREARNAKFYKQCFGKPCMLASDSHEKAEYDSIEKYTWIKADCSFEGLKQALIDYDNRICLKGMENLHWLKQWLGLKPNFSSTIDSIIQSSFLYFLQINIIKENCIFGKQDFYLLPSSYFRNGYYFLIIIIH